uniref:Transposase, MuDR, MULE transposase domain protein n=1 Tax=Tanacetum cinerariifolium TaxID=118510 RepID=A0A6L2M8Q7_TANCI|nr:transposase, MuDR, MULE transposase domain protein [Tanacetum cinerariifolium]
MRPLLITDGAHLKGTYKGINLVLVGMDGNNQNVPIATCVSQGETGESWTWFLLKFIECIGEVPNLAIITDRHPAIILACNTIFPNVFHGTTCHEPIANYQDSTQPRLKRSRQTMQESDIHVDSGGHSQEYEAAYTNNYVRSQEYEAAFNNMDGGSQGYEAAYTNFNSKFEQANINFGGRSQHSLPTTLFTISQLNLGQSSQQTYSTWDSSSWDPVNLTDP